MATADLYHEMSPASSIVAQAVTAPVNGAAVDLQGFDGALILIDAGTFSGTTPTATVKIQDSPDSTTWTDVAAANLIGGALPATIDTTNDVTLYERAYRGVQRYLRVIVSAVTGTTPSLPLSAVITRSNARKKPA